MMSGSGSIEFDHLKRAMATDQALRREVEFAFSSLLSAANPTDRGLRFLFGNGAEWIMAAAAWNAGVLVAPQGHNQNGFDLGDLLDQSRGLWSVKASASAASSQIRLRNFMGSGEAATWNEPTLFVSPYLAGAVLVDPTIHADVHDQVVQKRDAIVISAGVIKRFAEAHPANLIPFDVALNTGQSSYDPYAFIKSIITPEHFPKLSKPFVASSPVSASTAIDEVSKLAELRTSGVLSQEQFDQAFSKLMR